MQVEELIKIFTGEHTRQDLQDKLNLANRDNFRINYLQPALDEKLIELTIPEKPNSSKQKYRLTEKGILMKEKLI
jgi:ATP-dependent DNA helicase RecG